MIININGSKNSSLPILSCCLLCKGKYRISNVPKIKDVYNMLNLIKQFNVNILWEKKYITINTKNIYLPEKIKYIENFRASYYLIGSTSNMIVNKFNYEISIGCKIGKRPINYHIEFLEKIGYKVIQKNSQVSIFYNKKVSKYEELYHKVNKSIGSTLNCMILSINSNKIVYLEEYSIDPCIYDTIKFLEKMGANIKITKKHIKIIGGDVLKSSNHKIMYDPIETGTYIIFAGILKYKKIYSDLTIGPININNLGNFYRFFKEIGFIFIPDKVKQNYYTIDFIHNFSNTHKINIETGHYPGIYTDLQPFIVLLLSELEIDTELKENIWEDRFKYIKELNKIGYSITINNDTLHIKKKYKYRKIRKLNCYDLRADATLLFVSLLSGNYHDNIINLKFINRGYFNLNKNILDIYNIINNND